MAGSSADSLAAYADRLDAYLSGASDSDPGEPPIDDIRSVLAENGQQAADIAALRETVAAARKLIEPIWLAVVARIAPLWQAIEPLLEQADGAAPGAPLRPIGQAVNADGATTAAREG